MPLREFEGCRQRIARAEAHYRAFTEFWSSFIEDEPYSIIVQIRDNGWGGIWVEPRYQSLPPTLALELGETLYQLRAALDSCVYGAAIIETGQPIPPNPQHLEFPICYAPGDFPGSIWKIRPLSDKRRGIIESVQPYNTPALASDLVVFNFNRALGILNDWARKDRHRRLHIVGSWASRGTADLNLPAGVRAIWVSDPTTGFLEYSSKVISFRLDGFTPGMEVHVDTDVTVEVGVDEEPERCAGNDTLDNRVRAMNAAVRVVVKSIEDSFIEEGRVGPDPREFFYP